MDLSKIRWTSFGKGDKENAIVAQQLRMDEVVQDKDEQIVRLNKLLAEAIVEKEAAQREAAALHRVESVNEELRKETAQLADQLKAAEALVEELQLRVRAFECERGPAGPSSPSVNGSVDPYFYAHPERTRRDSSTRGPGSVAGSLTSSRSAYRMAPGERARWQDSQTRAMLFNK